MSEKGEKLNGKQAKREVEGRRAGSMDVSSDEEMKQRNGVLFRSHLGPVITGQPFAGLCIP